MNMDRLEAAITAFTLIGVALVMAAICCWGITLVLERI